MKAMLLAAGRATRMAPLTPSWAKPALPVLDEPLLHRLVRHLAEQGVEAVVVNAHENADELREALRDAPLPVELSIEPQLLGSGGGIRHARPLLAGSEPFLVLNADMCIELDLRELLEAHSRGGARVTLVLRDDPRKGEFGTIGYADGGAVCRITDWGERSAEHGCGLFTGAQVMASSLFESMPSQFPFDIVRDVYVPCLERGERIASFLQPEAALWWPVGTPRELLEANLLALDAATRECRNARIEAPDAQIAGELRSPVWVGARARVPAGARVGPRAVIGAGAVLSEGADIEESLVLPGAQPPASRPLRRAVAFGEAVWTDA